MVALLVLMFSVRKASLSVGTRRFYLFAVGMYAAGNWWIYVSVNIYGGAAPVLAGFLVALLVLSYALHSAVHGYVYMKYFHGRPLASLIAFPALWVLQEWVRTWFLTGFPWLYAGYGHLETPLSGFAPVLGVLGVSLLVLVSVSLIYGLLTKSVKRIPGLTMLMVLWAGGLMLKQIEFVSPSAESLKVSVLQGNVDQGSKWLRKSVVPILDLYTNMTTEELGRDLIVWPEAAITLFRENAGSYLNRMGELAKTHGSTIILGIPARDPDTRDSGIGRYYNTAISIGEGEGTYYKRRLVPFGEYVPLEAMLRGLIRAFDLPMSRNQPGPENQQPLTAGPYRISMSICYEIIYPNLVRTSVENPDLLVTISNDTWFGDSIGPKQHMQMARMRAIELGRYLVRGTNNGISALVNPQGEVVATIPQAVKGILRGEVKIMEGRTPYSRLGDWPVLLFCIAGLVMLNLAKRLPGGIPIGKSRLGSRQIRHDN